MVPTTGDTLQSTIIYVCSADVAFRNINPLKRTVCVWLYYFNYCLFGPTLVYAWLVVGGLLRHPHQLKQIPEYLLSFQLLLELYTEAFVS